MNADAVNDSCLDLSERPPIPLFFGDPQTRLFGCYHPVARSAFDCGVLVCNPVGHEYAVYHRTLRKLAQCLCRAGYPVLRFDLFGCGDSAGELGDASTARWISDVILAVDELCKRSKQEGVCLIGTRLSAMICALASARLVQLSGMVLWDPVPNGAMYVLGLHQLHNRLFPTATVPTDSWDGEALGYQLSTSLRAELARIDLNDTALSVAGPLLILETHRAGDSDQACRLNAMTVQREVIPGPPLWESILPSLTGSPRAVQMICNWFQTFGPCANEQ